MTANPGVSGEARDDASGPLASLTATLSIAAPAAGRLLAASLLGAASLAATIGLMAVSAWMLSRAAQHPGEAALGLAIVAVQAFGLTRGLARYGERLVGHDAAFRLLAAVRTRFYDHVAHLAPAGLVAFSHGELVARMVADVDGLQELLLRVIPPSLAAAIVGAGTVATCWVLLPGAGAITLVALALAVTAVPLLTSTVARRAAAHEADLRGALAVATVDLVEGAAELAVHGAADAAVARVAALDASLARATARTARLAGLGLSLATLLAGLAMVGNLAVGVAAVHDGAMRGVWLATLAVVPLAAFELVAPLPVAAQSLTRARRAAARIGAVMATPPPVPDPPAPRAVGPPPHRATAVHAWARYPGSSRDVLRGVDLALSPGRVVAVVGPSGAGKSTLAALLVAFLAATRGEVALDDAPYGAYAGDDVRRVVGLMEQVPHLFATSVAANLRVARPDADDGALVAALEAVGLADLVGTLPEGLETFVGRGGARLSGGQRQRLAAARVLLARWPIVVLDEPTEHLDAEGAARLLDALLDADPARATVLITHRLAGLERADAVIELDGGTAVEHLAARTSGSA